jgi:hypothetical protein
MKIPAIMIVLLALVASAFTRPVKAGDTEKTSNLLPAEKCSLFGVVSLTKNGESVAVDENALLYFCSENNFTLYAHNYAAQGSWIDNSKDILVSISVPNPEMDWLDGNWKVLARTDQLLEMEQKNKGDVWKVRMEGRQ